MRDNPSHMRNVCQFKSLCQWNLEYKYESMY